MVALQVGTGPLILNVCPVQTRLDAFFINYLHNNVISHNC